VLSGTRVLPSPCFLHSWLLLPEKFLAPIPHSLGINFLSPFHMGMLAGNYFGLEGRTFPRRKSVQYKTLPLQQARPGGGW